LHPALRKTVQIIEARLEGTIVIPDLAREVGMSHNHLIRLFRAKFKTTIEGYIRDRRIKRALNLLRYSTATVKSIAAEVGLPDLHQFNKAIRRECGRSPRAISGSQAV
jgi:AraC-like DNA-binding protein